MKINTTFKLLLVLIALAVFLRVYNFSFPAFTTDEARIAFRGYELYHNGVDELGRKLPFLFNSPDDYELPLVSYISALGTGFFGKSELGARVPFIIIGLILILLTYKVATQLSKEKYYSLFSALILILSPVLFFLSKAPNEYIVVATLILLLFYLLNKDRLNLIPITFTIILLFLTSKLSWFIVVPFVLYTIFVFRNNLNIRDKFKLSLISFTFTILAFVLFIQVPQGARSLAENNLSFFSDISIKNGIDWIRGQGLQSGWPPAVERILIGKALFLPIGFLHWLSNIQPAVLFGQFSKDTSLSFSGMGAFPKVLIVPALLGIAFLIKKGKRSLLLYPMIVVLPAAFIYPQLKSQVILFALPFIGYIIAFGLFQVNKIMKSLIIFLMVLELSVNFLFLSSEVNIMAKSRPYWIKPILLDASSVTGAGVFISDDIVRDPASFIEWFTPLKPQISAPDLKFPYKYRQTDFGKVKLLGLSDNLRLCQPGEVSSFFVTQRDLERVKKMGANTFIRTYSEDQGAVVVYRIEGEVCIN
ncbi:hypothetical protein A3D83_01080 [Candidatus Daviesbacteria bacterium RIFCSPHIGHO2_02_FULL_41_10]|uniref:Glycosyltransferase RgtA/B/C/D-like domain-containing protein n=1 Tax=Candidatus Daviesbacteria bacterium RIFCSPHIGHO2_02_FULL_41_10 TaxID=1797774 RepID=A0A1F5JY14_9BACT|nr:MAG: hypothetical protein A3D83_01080 [Candidatus Daviesbacteria bacterium RIFCSPHIGHO2_02_FULL_41_10]